MFGISRENICCPLETVCPSVNDSLPRRSHKICQPVFENCSPNRNDEAMGDDKVNVSRRMFITIS
jgi:hypothetical protein